MCAYFSNKEDFSVYDLREMFNRNKMILIIDQRVNTELLPKWFCEQNWHLVISLLEDSIISEKFREYKKLSITSDTIAKTGKDKILYMVGPDDDSELQDELARLIKVYDNQICVIGSDFKILKSKIIRAIFRNVRQSIKLPNAKILFFGVDDTVESCKEFMDSERIKDFDFNFYKYEPYDSISEEEIASLKQNDNQIIEGDVFYINNKSYPVDRLDQSMTLSWLTLVSEEKTEIGQVYLSSKSMRRSLYSRFLNLSSRDCTQWYGYSERSNFYIKRDFSDTLVELTLKALSGNMDEYGRFVPHNLLVLSGPPASSKSVSLGFLAYTIFNQKKYPVMVVNADTEIDDQRATQIDKMIEEINKISDTKVLLIWDNHDTEECKKLAEMLNHRGRKFVLVCCSYDSWKKSSRDIKYYDFKKIGSDSVKIVRNKLNNNYESLICYNEKEENWYIRASRRDALFNDRIRKVFSEYWSDLNWENIESQGWDVFQYFYYMIHALQKELEQGLNQEQEIIKTTLEDELERIFEDRINSSPTLLKNTNKGDFDNIKSAFGFSETEERFDDNNYDNIAQNDKYTWAVEALKKFQLCIAVFSFYDIQVPSVLAMGILDNDLINNSIVYSTGRNDSELYDFASRSIPWILRKDNDDGFEFVFRNISEAQLYIKNKFEDSDEGKEEYLDFVIDLLDLYSKYESPDTNIVDCLCRLLQCIGPNSQYKEKEGFDLPHYQYIYSNLNEIFNKLDDLIKSELDVGDSFLITSIIFKREYYNHKAKNDSSLSTDNEEYGKNLIEAIKGLRKTAEITQANIVACENDISHKDNRVKYRLINELANCCYSYCEKKDILKNLTCKNDPELKKCMNEFMPVDFETLVKWIMEAIGNENSNGYYYISLLKVFEKWSINFKITKKYMYLRLLGVIYSVLTESEDLRINNRGYGEKDELGERKQKFYEALTDDSELTLDDALDETEIYRDIEKHFKNDKDTLIVTICSRELMKSFNLDELSKKESMKRIVSYMMDKDRFKMLVSSKCKSAMVLLYRVLMNLYTGKDIFEIPSERKKLCIDLDGWSKLNKVCKKYIEFIDSDGKLRPKPYMSYMYALSTLYCSDFNFVKCKEIQQKYIHENDFDSSRLYERMYVPYLLCEINNNDDESDYMKFSGKVSYYDSERKIGYCIIDRCASNATYFDNYFAFSANDIANKGESIIEGQEMNGLIIGLSNTRCRVYTEEGIKRRRDNQRKDVKS
ncbi:MULTISPECIES: hypothetical protein [unclassified Ruminococcus]|uniref:hypothetical protein n=1 Tax=unclassified Ruminococcus TaxID=2608920 RepID=UPI0009306368|nr:MULTISPECIES: hypothetical protein [unclassified Ruminococcus]